MAKPRKPHPADLAQAETVARAVRFDVALFADGKFHKRSAATLNEAEIQGWMLANSFPNGRRPMIYAIDERGRSGLVTPTILAILQEQKTMAKAKPAKAKTAKAKTKRGPDEFKAEQAAKAAKPAKAKKAPVIADGEVAEANAAPKAAKPKAERPLGKRAAIEASARAGHMPSPPDFTAATHERYRPKLAEVVALAKARDLKGLRAYEINPYSTSPKAIKRYRDLAILALEAK